MPDDESQCRTPAIVQFTNSPRRRTNVTKACMACRMRKSKCSGTEPCEGCRSMNIECVRKRLPDMRRKSAVSKTTSNHPQHTQTLQNLLYLIRTLEEEPLKQLLHVVRMNVPIFELAGYMSEALAGAIVMPRNPPKVGAGPSRNSTTTTTEIARPTIRASGQPDTPSTLLSGSDQSCMLPIQLEVYKVPPGSLDQQPPLASTPSSVKEGLEQELRAFGLPVSVMSSESLQSTVPQLPSFSNLDPTTVPKHQKTEHELNWDEPKKAPQCHDNDDGSDWLWPLPMMSQGQNFDAVESWWSASLDMSLPSEHKASLPWDKHALLSQRRSDASFKVTVPIEAANSERPLLETRAAMYTCRSERPSHVQAIDCSGLITGPSFPSTSSGSICPPVTDPAASLRRLHETRLSGAPVWAACTSMGHLALPRLQQDSSSTSQAITAYLTFARLSISRGGPWIDVFGPDRPIVDLLFRPRQASDSHSVCNFVCEFCASLSGLEPPARFGMAFMMVYLIRWMLLPTPENYNKIPLMYKPTITQITLPHSVVVELCPLPQLRDALCRKARDFMRPLIDNISCSWPYSENSCVETLQGTDHVVLTDNFCLHVMSTENWVVRDALFDTFPECRGQIGVCA